VKKSIWITRESNHIDLAIQSIFEIQSSVMDEHASKVFYPYSTKEIRDILTNGGAYLVITMNNQPVACSAIEPACDTPHLPSDVLQSTTIGKSRMLGGACVIHDFRGLGIQNLMIEERIAWVKENDGAQTLLATVHPDNVYSMNNLEKAGMQCLTDQPAAMYGSVRHVFKMKID